MDIQKTTHIDIRLTLTEANDLKESLAELVCAYDAERAPRLNDPKYALASTLSMLINNLA